jgi:uncharacterized membrane protein
MQPSLAEPVPDPATGREAEHGQQPASGVAPGGLTDRGLAWLLLIGGLIGTVAAFVLAVEKYALLADPSYVPSCSLNPVLSCGSIMASAQAEAFGFPNPLLGVAGFPVIACTGAALLAGARPARWFWAGLQVGVTGGAMFVHWLIFNSLYRIGALCPYCMAVWAVTIPIFWYVTLHNLDQVSARLPRPLASVTTTLQRFHGVVLTTWFLLLTIAILHTFWLYWSTFLV